MKILYAASEALPYVASGGLADVAGSLPKALRKRLVGCRVVIPLYDSIKQELKDEMTFITSVTVPVAWRRQYCGIFEAHRGGVIYYLIDNQYYFKRGAIYGHYDDAERFAFFARAVLEILPHIGFKPDVIHCNDWQTALTPVFYQAFYKDRPGFENIKTLFTIHNIQYQGVYGMELVEDVLGLPPEMVPVIEYNGCVNLMKGAIEASDAVNTVSPTYAQEILDPWFSHGLDGILVRRREKLSGILNGIDTENYDPATDPDVPFHYSAEDFSAKAEDKKALQERFGLKADPDAPLIGMVTRLVSHKGLDLVKAVLDELLATTPAQVAVLGSGDWQYESFFNEMAARYPGKFGVYLGFVPELARKVYAGSDIFLMPSKSEPCGLAQMVALRYGSIPVVRETGGLKDTVTDSGDCKGNGFTFARYNAHDMLFTIKRAIDGYKDKEGWSILVKRAMECDNSWQSSANEYIRTYKAITGKKK